MSICSISVSKFLEDSVSLLFVAMFLVLTAELMLNEYLFSKSMNISIEC